MCRFHIRDIVWVTALTAALLAFWMAGQKARHLERLIRAERSTSQTARSEFERVLRENQGLREIQLMKDQAYNAERIRLWNEWEAMQRQGEPE
jgi:hypothetical protein